MALNYPDLALLFCTVSSWKWHLISFQPTPQLLSSEKSGLFLSQKYLVKKWMKDPFMTSLHLWIKSHSFTADPGCISAWPVMSYLKLYVKLYRMRILHWLCVCVGPIPILSRVWNGCPSSDHSDAIFLCKKICIPFASFSATQCTWWVFGDGMRDSDTVTISIHLFFSQQPCMLYIKLYE